MSKVLLKIIPCLSSWGIFISVVLQVPYPESLVQANLIQLGLFFITLYLVLIFTLNIFLKNILLSLFISLGLIFLLILKVLGSLNLITGLLTLISLGLFIDYFRKGKRKNPSINSGFKNLTKLSKIPKQRHFGK